jgi:NTE family protein
MAACFHFINPLHSGDNRDHSRDVDRRRHPRIGMALSSGGAKGLAHIGVIQVLEENGIHVDVIAGTSMGAYVGGFSAAGLNGQELESLAATMTSRGDLRQLVDPVLPPRRGFIGGRKVLARLRETLGERTFADLPKPFYCVATELNGFGRAVLHEGDVASAILASLAVPGVVTPVTRNGIEYIDGGVCEPLPVGILLECNCVDKIIAVNVLPKPDQTRRVKRETKHYKLYRNPLSWLNQRINLFAKGNLLDILRGAAMGSQMRLVERSAMRADVLINAVSDVPRWHDYNNYRSYIALGRAAAEKMLPELLALAGRSEAGSVNKNPEVTTCV